MNDLDLLIGKVARNSFTAGFVMVLMWQIFWRKP